MTHLKQASLQNPAQLLDPQGLEEDFSSKQVLTLGSEQHLRLHPGREAGWAWDTHLYGVCRGWGGNPSLWGPGDKEYTHPQTPWHTGNMFLFLPRVGGGVLTIAHALQEVFEGLSQLPWLQSDGQNML